MDVVLGGLLVVFGRHASVQVLEVGLQVVAYFLVSLQFLEFVGFHDAAELP